MHDADEQAGGAGRVTKGDALATVARLLWWGSLVVVSDARSLGGRDEIQVADFTFDLDVGPHQTLLVAKGMRGASLAELIDQPTRWTFLGSLADVDIVRSRLLEALATARAGIGRPDEPFAHIRAIAEDPNWTGVLMLGCRVSSRSLPAPLTRSARAWRASPILVSSHPPVRSTPSPTWRSPSAKPVRTGSSAWPSAWFAIARTAAPPSCCPTSRSRRSHGTSHG